MWHRIRSPARRVAYYTAAVARECRPAGCWRADRRHRFAALAAAGADEDLIERVNYYNRLPAGTPLDEAPTLRGISRRKSYYYYDLRQFTLAFDPRLRLAYAFGDVTAVPTVPAVVKSRPVIDGNANAVLMKLDRLRHFSFDRDSQPFADKRPAAVWRGALNNDSRRRLVEAYRDHPEFDIGHVGPAHGTIRPRRHLTVDQQRGYRYIVSLEGNDVATNLKWIMASNALCLMPRPRFETWFMEGRLEPGRHYALLRDDLADLAEKVDHYERHPGEALEIIAAAHAHVARFMDRRREELISLLVLEKYFERTGQLPVSPLSPQVFV